MRPCERPPFWIGAKEQRIPFLPFKEFPVVRNHWAYESLVEFTCI